VKEWIDLFKFIFIGKVVLNGEKWDLINIPEYRGLIIVENTACLKLVEFNLCCLLQSGKFDFAYNHSGRTFYFKSGATVMIKTVYSVNESTFRGIDFYNRVVNSFKLSFFRSPLSEIIESGIFYNASTANMSEIGYDSMEINSI
jgi:hypothetical protein